VTNPIKNLIICHYSCRVKIFENKSDTWQRPEEIKLRAGSGPWAASWSSLVYAIGPQMAAKLSALRTDTILLPKNIIIFLFLLLISVRG
jgi:hypothetical protein